MGNKLNVLIACEFTGTMRREFHKRGHFAVSCDLLPSIEPWHGFNPWHYQGDVFEILERRARPFYDRLNSIVWDLMITHAPCTFLCNSGVRWLYGGKGHTIDRVRWNNMHEGARFFERLANWQGIPYIGAENPVMHPYAKDLIGRGPTQIVQPWWFGDEAFKATGWWLKQLPPLRPTNKLKPPKPGTERHKAWSKVHRASPGPNRWAERSATYPGIAAAAASQWGDYVMERLL